MRLSKKSWHAWLYKMTYGYRNFPTNLCPYFWKVMAAIPLTVIMLPFHLVSYTVMKIEDDDDYKRGYFYSDNLSYSFGLNFLTCCVVGILGMFFSGWGKPNFFNVFGIVGIVIAIAIFFFWASEENKWSEWFPKKRKAIKEKIIKDKKPNIITEFIKAKYNRYCPKIDWENRANNK